MFVIQQALEIIETRINENSNSCELDYYIKLREELTEKLARFLQDPKCDFCEVSCGNEWCITKTEEK